MSDKQKRAENLIDCIISGCENISELDKNTITRDNFHITSEPENNKKWVLISVKNPNQNRLTESEKNKIKNINDKIKKSCSNCVKHYKGVKINDINKYEPSNQMEKYIEIKIN